MYSMQSNTQRSSGRPLLFNNKTGMHAFVMGNASQAFSVSVPQGAPRTAPAFYPSSSLFDRYNRPNLSLRDCDSKDIFVLHKNLVMSEQPLSKDVVEEVSQKAARTKVKDLMATGENFQKQSSPDQFLKTAPALPSREFQQNEIMFNYKEMAEIKRGKKMQFLEEIEQRIVEAQQEIAGLEELQAEERVEMNDLGRFQQKVGEQLSKNVEVGRIKQKVGYVTGFEEEEVYQPISIHKEMEPRQINEVLEEHIRVNEDLLELAGSVRRRSSEKSKEKLEKTGTNTSTFNNTMRRVNEQNKTLVNTMKTGYKPPKSKARK